MSLAQMSAFGAWAGVAVLAVVALLFGIPWIARIVFLTRLEALRDEAVDKILDHEFPADDAALLEFIQIQEGFRQHCRQVTVGRAIAYSFALEKTDVKPHAPAPRNGLTVEQRRELHRLEKQSKAALGSYLIWGSALGFMGYGVYRLVHPAKGPQHRRTPPVAATTPNSQALAASTYAHAREEIRATGIDKSAAFSADGLIGVY